jgi:hypothetical protein
VILATAWFLWNMKSIYNNPTFKVIDVQRYATLGNFKKYKKEK